MNDNQAPPKQQLLIDALDHLRQAIDLLDLAAAPGHIAAHIDLALNQVENELSVETPLGLSSGDPNPDDRRTIETF